MKVALPLFLTLNWVLSGCVTHPTAVDERRQLQAQLGGIVVEDGISAAEADVIAQSYFLRFGPGCGSAPRVTDEGEFWVSWTVVGYAAVPTREPIRIDKHSGRVTWSDGPTKEDPKTIW